MTTAADVTTAEKGIGPFVNTYDKSDSYLERLSGYEYVGNDLPDGEGAYCKVIRSYDEFVSLTAWNYSKKGRVVDNSFFENYYALVLKRKYALPKKYTDIGFENAVINEDGGKIDLECREIPRMFSSQGKISIIHIFIIPKNAVSLSYDGSVLEMNINYNVKNIYKTVTADDDLNSLSGAKDGQMWIFKTEEQLSSFLKDNSLTYTMLDYVDDTYAVAVYFSDLHEDIYGFRNLMCLDGKISVDLDVKKYDGFLNERREGVYVFFVPKSEVDGDLTSAADSTVNIFEF